MKQLIHYILALIVWIACFVPHVGAQNRTWVNVSFNIIPPYSPYLSDYTGVNAQKVLITLQNTYPEHLEGKFVLTIKGDNGFSARTKSGYVPLNPLLMASNSVQQLNGMAIAELLNISHFDINGGNRDQILRTQRLPEGNYEVCLQVLALDGTVYSEESCTYMQVFYPDPPVLIAPLPSDTVFMTGPQLVNFVWMLPGNTPLQGTTYTITLAEMPDATVNPNQVLDAASWPLLSHTTQQTTYLYSLGDQPLQPGKSYAWRVKAETLGGSDMQPLFKNNGYSAAQVFHVKEVTTVAPYPDKKADPITDRLPTDKKQDSIPKRGHTLQANIVYQYEGSAERHPYQGKVYLHSVDEVGIASPVPIGSGIAESNGHCTIRFDAAVDTSMVYRIRLNNPYLAEPEQTIKFANTDLAVGEVVAIVRAYSLRVALTKGYKNPLQDRKLIEALDGAAVSVYRRGKNSNIPVYEAGKAVQANAGNKDLPVASGTTRIVYDDNKKPRAVVDFEQLVWNLNGGEDGYLIKVSEKGKKESSVDEAFSFNPNKPDSRGEKKAGTQHTYTVSTTLHIDTKEEPHASVSGRLLYRWHDGQSGAHPATRVKVKLIPFYVFEDPKTGKTVGVEMDAHNSETRIAAVDANNNVINVDPNDRFNGRPQVISQPVATAETDTDGYFHFKDFVLYDEVFTYEGYYNVTNLPPHEVPKQIPHENLLEDKLRLGRNLTRDDLFRNYFDFGNLFQPLPHQAGLPGQLTAADLLGYGGGLATIGLGVRVNSTNKKINTVVNSPSVTTKAGQATIATQQFHSHSQVNGSWMDNWSFSALSYRQGGPSAWEPTIAATTAPDFKYDKPMRLRRSFRVVVEDTRLCSPDDNIDVNPFDSIDVGTIYSVINSYKLRVKVVEQESGKNSVVLRGKGQIEANKQNAVWDVRMLLQGKTPSNKLRLNGELYMPTGGHTQPLSDEYSNIAELYTQENVEKNSFGYLVRHTGYKIDALTNDTVNTTNAYQHSENYSFGLGGGSSLSSVLFNSNFVEETEDIIIPLLPKKPIIAGRLLNTQGNQPLSGVKVHLKRVAGAAPFYTRTVLTDDEGYFVFSDLLEKLSYKLETSVPGYHAVGDQVANTHIATREIPEMTKGTKAFFDILFQPASRVQGFVVNEQGKKIEALVKVEATGAIHSTGCKPGSLYQIVPKHLTGVEPSPCKGNFMDAYVPSGRQTRIIIQPIDMTYFADTLFLSAQRSGITDVGNIVVKTREHRMRFEVSGLKSTSDVIGQQNIALAGTRIEILDTVLLTSASSTALRSSVRYQFANITQKNFWVKVIPPEGSGFVARELTLTNHESKTDSTYRITLERGDVVWGKVTVNGQPVTNAEVKIEVGGSVPVLVRSTDETGNYRIDGIPKVQGQVNVAVSVTGKDPSGRFIAGKTQKAKTNSELNFELQEYGKLDLSRLLGYPIKVTHLIEEGVNTLINGELVLPDNESGFALPDKNNRLSFTKMAVRANTAGLLNDQGTPYAEPVQDVSLNQTAYLLRFADTYNVKLEGPSKQRLPNLPTKLLLRKAGPLSGYLEVYARVVDNSFNFPSSYLNFGDAQFYFAQANGIEYSNLLHLYRTEQSVYTSGNRIGNSTIPKWHFSSEKGGELVFNYLGFKALSDVGNSYFANGKMHIQPVIHTRISTLDGKELEIAMPQVKFDTKRLEEVSGDQPITFKIEEWTVNVGKWTASPEVGGIEGIGNNNIRTNAGISIPFQTFRLTHVAGQDELLIEGARPKDIKLGGFHPVVFTGDPRVVFGLDAKTGSDLKPHYVLRMLADGDQVLGHIKGLPGFKAPLDLQAITLLSDGKQYISFAPNAAATSVHDVVDFKPLTIADTDGGFVVMGNMDFGVPNLPGQYAGFRFVQNGGKTVTSFEINELSFETKGNVVFASVRSQEDENGKKFIRPGELELNGTVTEPGKMGEIPVRLLKKMNGGRAVIDIEQRPHVYAMAMERDMVMNVTNTRSMVSSGQWDNLRFTGKMRSSFASGGLGNSAMDFVVHGDIVANGKGLQIKGINTPFGEMKLVMDWRKKEILGSIAVADAQGNTIEIAPQINGKGVAEMAMSSRGFYLASSLSANIGFLPPPFNSLSAGIVLGYHNRIPEEVFDKATQHMYNRRYPCDKNGINFKGFMLAARKDFLDKVEFGLDFDPIADFSVRLEAGTDLTFFANFDQGVHVEIFPAVFGSARASMKSGILCTQLSGWQKLNMTGRFAYKKGNLSGEVAAKLGMGIRYRQSTPPLCTPTLFDLNQSIDLGSRFGFDNGKPYFRLFGGGAESGGDVCIQ